VSGSEAIIESISSSLAARIRRKSARGLDLLISFRERLTVCIARSPFCYTSRYYSSSIAAPRIHDNEKIIQDSSSRYEQRLAVVAAGIRFLEARLFEDKRGVVESKSAFNAVMSAFKLIPLEKQMRWHYTGFTYTGTIPASTFFGRCRSASYDGM
jgi:hypothetical protein